MIPNLRKALFSLALVAVAISLAMPQSAITLLFRLAVSGTTCAAIWRGIVTYKPQRPLASHFQHPDPWTLIGGAVALRAIGDVLRFAAHGSPTGGLSVFVSVAGLLMVFVTGLALTEMLRQRFGDRAWDHGFEAVIAAGTLSMVMWVTLVAPMLNAHDETSQNGVASAIAFTLAMVLASLSLHLVTSFENRQPAFTALSVGQVVPVIASLLAFVANYSSTQGWASLSSALPMLGLAFVGYGALEPSMALYEEPSGPAGARLGRLRLATLIIPVVLGPTVLTLSITNIVAVSPMAIAIYTIALSLLVVGHLIEMVQARASSTHWASHDKLTGLPNRALFRERTAQALERARKMNYSVSIMYLDLDRFKHINDSMGHEAGDQLLEQVARRILACCDPADTVARLGGDEFAILLSAVDDDEIPRKLARRMLKKFSAPFNLRPRPVFMSPSVGIAVSDGNVSLETLLTQADTAMYRAKESGRNNFAVWSQEMNEASKQRLMLETHLHSAITNDELRLVYQPKVQLSTGRIVGCEALIRWHHPKLGVISPSVFIHLAEESGLINQIGEWVLQTACLQARAWYDAGYTNLTMAVNLSSRQFQQQKVADMVSSVLRQSRLAPHLLELELTESVAMSGDESTMTSLRELREMGVKTSIDDFGTGYSNLSYLSRFPINNLKIDKSFIDKINKSQGDSAIVVAIIAMAHGLGLNVIAEGVEQPEQAAFLAQHNCDELQGYLFSKALPPSEFEGLLMLERVSNVSPATTSADAAPVPVPASAPDAAPAALRPPEPVAVAANGARRLERTMPERERIAQPVPTPAPPAANGHTGRTESNASRAQTKSAPPKPYDPFSSGA